MNNFHTYADGYGRWHALVPASDSQRNDAVAAIWSRISDFVEEEYLPILVDSLQVEPLSSWDGVVPDGEWAHFSEYEIR